MTKRRKIVHAQIVTWLAEAPKSHPQTWKRITGPGKAPQRLLAPPESPYVLRWGLQGKNAYGRLNVAATEAILVDAEAKGWDSTDLAVSLSLGVGQDIGKFALLVTRRGKEYGGNALSIIQRNAGKPWMVFRCVELCSIQFAGATSLDFRQGYWIGKLGNTADGYIPRAETLDTLGDS